MNIQKYGDDSRRYNGWTNYETWLCNLWFENFDFTDMMDMFDNCEDNCDVLDIIENYIKEHVEESVEYSLVAAWGVTTSRCGDISPSDQHGFIHDMLNAAISGIDWRDIAEHYVDVVVDELKLIKDDAKSNSELMGV